MFNGSERKAGDFVVTVSSGYPYWIVISYGDNQKISGLRHTELSDLIYALERIKKDLIGGIEEKYEV